MSVAAETRRIFPRTLAKLELERRAQCCLWCGASQGIVPCTLYCMLSNGGSTTASVTTTLMLASFLLYMRKDRDADAAESLLACSSCRINYCKGELDLPLWLRRDMQQCP